ncbi:nucleotidyltransferase domain-containing protein [Oscillatoria sp. CS-180]|uniref:nucleotidyltransferase family protein n=1 Tax=Oscillatoria sp. CS-180 TaxID=3021720 RepID=UPI00232AC9CB|nr:nucleotidyltransferase domain-containing protein [Oscillatoria sp. CS-180]MDB9524918.1 nucleotidyltransferase domain-containing protein [Oscillatoria sp. CS-180]
MPLHHRVERVFLFSSVTRTGQFRRRSDIDVAIEGTDAETYFAFWRDLENACQDWMIDLREINTPSHFAETVRPYGELVYERSNRVTKR